MKITRYNTKNNDLTINQFLKNELNISNRLLAKLIKNKNILLNDKITDTRQTISFDDKIDILLDYPEDCDNIVPTKMNLDIIYEDDGLLIINKPAGIATHPSIAHYSDSLCNGIKYYFEKTGLKKKIRPVNRLDLNTSGLIIFAKNEYIQEYLINQMKTNTFKKEYIAIVEGYFKDKKGTINLPIARKKGSIIERCIDDSGQTSITHYEVLKENNNYSLVKCILETGRTHQIRVHMSYIGHPIVGDTLYGLKENTKTFYNRHALHCYKLSFINPITNCIEEYTSPIPNEFKILFT